MKNAFHPHMEWAKAHTKTPLPIELGFSGAPAPRGRAWQEFGSGHPELTRLVARRYGVSQSRVYLAGGTSLANFVAIAAFCDPGDLVAVEVPRYASLAEIPRSLGAKVVDIPRQPNGQLGRIPKRAGLIVVTSPHNPTGRVLSREDWAALGHAADRGAIVLVDEVYRDLQPRRPKVAATRHERFVTTGGLTKAFGLGALRLGWVLGAPELLDRIRKVDNLVSVQCATPSLIKLLETWPKLDALAERARRPVEKNIEALRASGLTFAEPQAGLTAFVKVKDGDVCARECERRGVGVARGSFFDAPQYVRLYLGANPTQFARGVQILARVNETAKRGARLI